MKLTRTNSKVETTDIRKYLNLYPSLQDIETGCNSNVSCFELTKGTHDSSSKKLVIRTREGIELVPQESIVYIEASSNYCLIYLFDGSKRIVSKCMKYILEALHPSSFLKVHRKYAVNMNYVTQLDTQTSELHLETGKSVSISRALKKQVRSRILEAV